VQDRYAGDVGDFGKLALLRALSPGRRLGVCWYRTDGVGETNNDGRHLAYLDRPERFRALDAELFEALRAFVDDCRAGRSPRSVAALEALGVLPTDTAFHGQLCPRTLSARREWAAHMLAAMARADLVFLDPDNGLQTAAPGPKSAGLDELEALRRAGRSLLLYHHQTRRAGGAPVEAAHIGRCLLDAGFEAVDAVRLRPYSSRFYFLIDGDDLLRARLEEFAGRWGRRVQHFPALG
jgi:hypothetical protein